MTYKPRRDMWLKRHKNGHFHFTPTHASWLNQAEIWFSILSGKSLHGASFQSVPELIAHMDAFIGATMKPQGLSSGPKAKFNKNASRVQQPDDARSRVIANKGG
jgi:hypothetical protein